MPLLKHSLSWQIRRVFSMLWLIIVFLPEVSHSAPRECERLEVKPDTGIVLNEGGNFCLANDIRIDDAGVFVSHGRDRPGYAIDLHSDGVTLDLQGHVVTYGNSTDGVRITHRSRGKPIVIRNGKFIAAITGGIESGFYNGLVPSDVGDPLDSISKWGKSSDELAAKRQRLKELDESLILDQKKLRPATSAGYTDRNIVLENLHILVPGVDGAGAGPGAINLEGGKITIRNCIIETNYGTAIWLFGPSALIEGNTIIVRGAHSLREADAAIRLIQADGAIVRNNKIIIKGKANRRAISVFDTGAITVENNTMVGISSDDEWAKAFIGSLQMTKAGNTFEPGWKSLFH